MNSKLKELKRQLERAGGLVMIPDHLPDDVAEIFVKEIMDCPECAAAIAASSKQTKMTREH